MKMQVIINTEADTLSQCRPCIFVLNNRCAAAITQRPMDL